MATLEDRFKGERAARRERERALRQAEGQLQTARRSISFSLLRPGSRASLTSLAGELGIGAAGVALESHALPRSGRSTASLAETEA